MKNILILLAICCTCCSKRPECPGTIVEDPSLSFVLVSKGGIPLIGDYGRKYDAKYTKFENADGSKFYQFSIEAGRGSVNCNLVKQYSYSSVADSSFNTYYLKLPLPDTSLMRLYDVDTIKTITKMKYNTVCKVHLLEEVSIIYNDSMYYKSSKQLPLILKFTKK